MFIVARTVLASPGSRLTSMSGVNMSMVVSLRSRLACRLAQARDWLRRSLRPRTAGPNDKRDDLYEIFLFGPHG
jgi:hypothetical protein